MNMILRNITSVILALIVLVTTCGFRVFEHHCQAEKTTDYSFVVPSFDCDHTEHDHAEDLPPCCELNHPSQSGEECGENDCCNIDSFVVKLNITLDKQDFRKKLSSNILSIPVNSDMEVLPADLETQHITISNDLPPPLSGRALHIYLNQLNIPYASV